MSEWFSGVGEDLGSVKQGVITEVLCELPPKLTQRTEALHGRQAASALSLSKAHGDDLQTFPPLFNGEDATSRQRRWQGLQTAASKMEGAFKAFGRDRDRDDFQRLWVNYLAPTSPQRLLASAHVQYCPEAAPYGTGTQSAAAGPVHGAIPTLLLSTNGASMADRLDLYGAFASYLRGQQGAYVALLRPEDLAAGVGSCFGSALAQLSGLQDSAAEDIMGLLAWYEHETGRGKQPESNPNGDAGAVSAALSAPKTPGRGAAKTPGKGARGKTPGRGVQDADGAGAAGADNGEGTVAARLRARRGQLGKVAAAAAEADARTAREAQEAVYARNRQRHVVLLVEAAGRVTDRGALRALLAALHGERHRLPIVLVLGVSTPAALYASKLPADVAAMLQLTAAELAPHPLQLHRLFQDVLLAPQAPPPLLLDGATMRELLLQSRLLEPSLACLQAALLEANEQHFRREPLSPLALLPLQQHMANEAAAAAAARRNLPTARSRPGSKDGDDGDDSSSDGDESDDGGESSPYMSAQSKGDGGDEADLCDGPYGLAGVGDDWLERRRQRHSARLAAAVSELPSGLLRAACSSLSAAAAAAKENGGAAAARQQVSTEAVCEAVAEAFSALSAWRLGLRWLAVLAERTGAIQLPGGHRYALPSLYVAAASPRFWKPPHAAVAAAVAAGCSAGNQAAKSSAGASTSAALAAASLGETLLTGVLGPKLTGRSAAAKANPRGTLRAVPEEEVDLLLDDLLDAAREALLHDWLPAETVMRAAKGLAELRQSLNQEMDEAFNGEVAGGAHAAAADADDETSPVRRRLAAQGLTSPPTAEKLKGVTERFGRMDPLPAPKLLQPNNAPPQQTQAQPPSKPAAGAAAPPPGSTAAGTTHASVKLPSSGQTQSKRQRDKALLAAVQQRAAAGASAAAAAEAAGGPAAAAAPTFADRLVDFLAGTLRGLLATCPFHLPGSAAFTFRDATGLQRRLVGAPSLALHMALTEPELILKDLAPGLHPGQEDAAIAYQLLVGCKDGVDLRDWLAEFCAASGLGRVQEVQEEEGEEDVEEEEDAEKKEDGPVGRSRTSRRRHAPRKRKAAPKQEMVLALEGPQAEAAVDAMACRFEQVARELEMVGLCRFSKRRKGLYVHRTYFPPEAIV